MPRTSKPTSTSAIALPAIPGDTELVGLAFSLRPSLSGDLYSQYTIGLHAWFLDQIRQIDPALSAYLHDGESEKAFTITGLNGQFRSHGLQLQVQAEKDYSWQITALSKPVVQGLVKWLGRFPDRVILKDTPFQIQAVQLVPSPTTYRAIWERAAEESGAVSISFLSPTSFRRKGHHFPLPVPANLFHSYLRRWNDFSGMPIEQEAFLDWVEEQVIIQQVRLESVKVAAGKRGTVTGFTGAVSLGLGSRSAENSEFRQLFYALVLLAPYCGTGHKTTFGLGQTQLGWLAEEQEVLLPTEEEALAERMAELTQLFLMQRKRTGGDRALHVAETWATILARRERGESLLDIAGDLNMRYETVKTYAKLARRSLREMEE
jgi:CRISPR-associated endoribonuclease Cas6